MKIIKSLNNEKIKELKKQKANDKSLLFLDSPKLGEEAFNSGIKPYHILIDENKFLNLKKEFDFINKLDENFIILVDEKIIKIFSDVITSQGFVGIFKSKNCTLKKPKKNFLVLDNVQDAGNVGTLIRTALGAGFNDVYLLDCASVTNIKTIRSSMGAVFKLNVYETTMQNFIDFAKSIPQTLYGTDMKGENIYNFNFTLPCGVVLGNEGKGIRAEMRKILHNTISIPIEPKLESLNVAVAGGIIMFEINKRGEADF